MADTFAVGSDHAGYALKMVVVGHLQASGYTVIDVGTDSPDASVDYPDFAQAVGQAVIDGRASRGVIVCGSGAGACIAANKMHGIRAAVCHDTYSAHQGVEHDDVNVLCLGGRVIGEALALEIVSTWCAASFTGEDRHARRLAKIEAIERGQGQPA